MAADEKTASRGTIATVVATAAVTLAMGVTAAALGGYLVPMRDRNETKPTASTAVEARPAIEPSTPNVVLVPVTPDSREPAINAPVPPDVLLANREPTDDHDEDSDGHHRRRGLYERGHEDDHDD